MNRFQQLLLDFGPALGLGFKRRTPPKKPSDAKNRHAPKKRTRGGFDSILTAQARGWSTALSQRKLSSEVRVVWNRRLRTTAGLANPIRLEIELNRKIESLGDEVVERILKHELAHLVAHQRARGRRIAAHGPEWRQACNELGIPGEKSCHTLPLDIRRQKRKYGYQCPHCQSVMLRVRPLARYSACWSCCKTYNKSRYSSRFQYEKIPLETAIQLSDQQDQTSPDGQMPKTERKDL